GPALVVRRGRPRGRGLLPAHGRRLRRAHPGDPRPAQAPVTFRAGANLPWLHYGLDFGANRWQPGGGTARAERRNELRAVFARVRDAGIPLVRWFAIGDGRAGLVSDETGS